MDAEARTADATSQRLKESTINAFPPIAVSLSATAQTVKRDLSNFLIVLAEDLEPAAHTCAPANKSLQ